MLFHPLFKLRPLQHDDASTALALDLDVRADANDDPAVAAAGVLLARLDQIAQCKLDHGLASSIRFRRPAPGLRPGNGASLYDYNTSLSPLHEKERSAFYFCAAP